MRKSVEFLRRYFDMEVSISRFVEKAAGTVAALTFTVGIGVGTSIAGSDPTPAIYWLTCAGIAAVIAVFLFDDVKELRRWQRIGVIVFVGIAAVIGVTYGDSWASDKAVAAAVEKQRQIAIEGEAEVKKIRSEFEKKRVAAANPLNFTTLVSGAKYVPGTVISGVQLRHFFTELDLLVTNPTDGNYSDMDILVRPDFPVAQIKQLSGLQGVSFEDYFGVTARNTIEDLDTHETVLMNFLATDAGYRVHCGLIPPHQSLRLMFILVDFKPSGIPPKPGHPIPIDGELTPDRLQGVYSLLAKDGTKGNYWFGNIKNESFYKSRPSPERVSVSGQYTVEGVRIDVKKDVSVPKTQPIITPKPVHIIEHRHK